VDDVDIFSCESAADYLRQILKSRAASRSSLSLRSFAKRAGIQSPATLTLILQNKRSVSEAVAEQVSRALKLSGYRRRYWSTLAQLSRCAFVEERLNLREELLYLRAFSLAKQLELRQYRILSQWHYCVLYVLAEFPEFRLDFQWLAKGLGRGITPKDVELAVTDLLEHGLLRREGDRVVQGSGAVVKTAEDVKDLSIRQLHRRMLHLAAQSLELPLDEREVTGLTVALSPSSLPVLKEKIRIFREEIDQFLTKAGGREEVYQLNLQLFPLTQFKGRVR
jgi:uncharacterized protein (TIGR02147 family)